MIAIGSDHGGYGLKQEIMAHLKEQGVEYKDYGCYDEKSCDYPVYAKKVANAIVSGECEKGILICGTGIGISITANKVKGIRVVGPGLALQIVDTFLNTEFSNDERHIRRINMIEED